MDATHHRRLRGMRIAPGPLWAGVMPIGIRQRPAGRRPLSLQPEKRETTCGLWQSRPSSKPLAASAIAPDPCRGWGRNPSAHIRAQREPVVPPAGTGTEYHRPEGSPDGSPRRDRPGVRRPFTIDGSMSINGIAADAIRGETAFSSRGPVAGQRDAHTVAEGGVCWGIPPGAGGWPRRSERPAWRLNSAASGRFAGSSLLARRPTLACRAIDRQRALAIRVAAA